MAEVVVEVRLALPEGVEGSDFASYVEEAVRGWAGGGNADGWTGLFGGATAVVRGRASVMLMGGEGAVVAVLDDGSGGARPCGAGRTDREALGDLVLQRADSMGIEVRREGSRG